MDLPIPLLIGPPFDHEVQITRSHSAPGISRYFNIFRYAVWFNLIEIILQSLNIVANYLVYLFILSPLTANQTLSQVLGVIFAVAIGYAIRRFEKTGKLELLLHRDRRIPKKSFKSCKLIRDWNEYFLTQMRISGLSPISYPAKDENYRLSIPAYEIIRFEGSESSWPTFVDDGKRNTGHKSFYRDRYVEDAETEDEARNKFTKQEIEDFGVMIRAELRNLPAVWVVGISTSGVVPVIKYTVAHYYSSLVLVNQISYMAGAFPREGTRGYPIFVVQGQMQNLREMRFDQLFEEIPAILGVEVILVTSDNKILLQRRSSREAVARGRITSSTSSGYRDYYLTLRDEDYLQVEPSLTSQEKHPAIWGALKQVQNELGLHVQRGEITSEKLIALVHVLPSNEINFVVSMRTPMGASDVIRIINASRSSKKNSSWRRIQEIWEHDAIMSFELSEVRSFSGEFRTYFLKHRRNMERAIIALRYACEI